MTQYEKLLEKFLENPWSLKFLEIENILFKNWFIREEARWSHTKYKNWKYYILVAIHNNEIKLIYKKKIKKVILEIMQGETQGEE